MVLSVPIGGATFILLFITMPRRLALEPSGRTTQPGKRLDLLRSLRSLDFPGVLLLLGAPMLLMAALQQAAIGVPWHSPQVLALLILSPFFLAGFVAWERLLTVKPWGMEPLFSWNLITNRVFIAMLL